jgi:hypothetical protein
MPALQEGAEYYYPVYEPHFPRTEYKRLGFYSDPVNRPTARMLSLRATLLPNGGARSRPRTGTPSMTRRCSLPCSTRLTRCEWTDQDDGEAEAHREAPRCNDSC